MSEDEVLIPEGFFTMGCQDLVCWGPDLCVEWCISEDELPAHNVMLDTFFIDTHEVTNEQFVEFLSSHGNVCNSFDPDNESVCYAPDETDELYDPVLYLDNGTWQAEPGFEDHPAVWITWYGAMEYCASLGKRLPTEAEWEKAARGGLEGTVYPWGDEASDCTRANFYYFEIVYSEPEGMTFSPRYCSEDLTAPVGSYDTNGYALYDMAGNVQEWTADWYDALYYETSVSDNPAGPDNGTQAVLRGGGWNLLDYDMRCAARNRQNRSQTNAYTGFRCAW